MKRKKFLPLVFAATTVLFRHGLGYTAEICSPEGISTLKGLGADPKKVESYCKKGEQNKVNATEIYDLTGGKNDWAEVIDDLASGKAVGKHISLRLRAALSAYCIQGSLIDSGKQTLTCWVDSGSTTTFVYSKSKDIRVDLLKKREDSETLTIKGTIIERFIDKPVIEISDVIPGKRNK